MNANRRDGGSVTTRRTFVRRAAAGAGGLALPWLVPARALGRGGAVAAGDLIALGAIGFGPRCRHVLGCMLEEPDVRCVAVCDVQASRREAAKAAVDGRYGDQGCAAYRDFRELLARDDLDAVLVATGDRWHGAASVLAARAGKDVYSEKPCAMTLADCVLLDETMRRYGRVFQAGTQRRSIGNFQRAVEAVRRGLVGRLHTLRASVYVPQRRFDWLPAEPEPPRDVVDWDLWLGPAPWRPYNHAYVGGGWRGFDDFNSGAMLLDWGAHTVDLCQWANGSDGTGPVEFEPAADGIHARYANGVRLILDFLPDPFGNRGPLYRTALGTCPVRYEGDAGWIETGDSGDLAAHPASLEAELRNLRAARRQAGTDASSHGRNFFDCVRSRAATAANAAVARRSHAACLAAAVSWILQRKLAFDPATETFPGDPEANRLRARPPREPWRL